MSAARGSSGMNYHATFITVAGDCPAKTAVVPAAKRGGPSVAEIQYELLAGEPRRYTQEELLFEVHLRRLGEPLESLAKRRDELWREFFSKPQACLRASPLPKRFGWGIHFDEAGRIALVAVESPEYARLATGLDGRLKVLPAMRNERA